MRNAKSAKKFQVLFVVAFIITSLASCMSHTPKIHNSNGISELRKIELGNVQQTILIRGKDRTNPILLYLHGGPGTTELIPFRIYQNDLEDYFTIVVWEQRGTGKSFSRKIPAETMTIKQFILDRVN